MKTRNQNQRSWVRVCFPLVLAVVLLCQPSFSDWRRLFPLGVTVTPASKTAIDPSQLAVMPNAMEFGQPFLIDPSAFNSHNEQFAENTEKELEEVRPILDALHKKVISYSETKTPQEFDELLAKDKIEIDDKKEFPGARAVARKAGDQVFYRVVHEKSGRSYIIYHDSYDPNSEAHQTMLARQLLDSGIANTAGRKPGRDVTIVTRHSDTGELTKIEDFERPDPGSSEWWKQWKRGIGNTKVRLGNIFYIGVPATIGQVTLIFLWGWVGNQPLDKTLITSTFAVIFSMTICTLVDGYRKFINFGAESNQSSAIVRIIKHNMISFAFAYPVVAVKNGVESVLLLSTFIAITVNSFLHNLARGTWKLISSSQNELRSVSGDVDVSLRVGPWQLPQGRVNRASLLEQLVLEPIMFNFKYIGLVGIGYAVSFNYFKIDAGTLLLMASIPVAQLIASLNVRRIISRIPLDERSDKHISMLKRVDGAAKALLTLPFRLPKEIAQFIYRLGKETYEFYGPLIGRTAATAVVSGYSTCRNTGLKIIRKLFME